MNQKYCEFTNIFPERLILIWKTITIGKIEIGTILSHYPGRMKVLIIATRLIRAGRWLPGSGESVEVFGATPHHWHASIGGIRRMQMHNAPLYMLIRKHTYM